MPLFYHIANKETTGKCRLFEKTPEIREENSEKEHAYAEYSLDICINVSYNSHIIFSGR